MPYDYGKKGKVIKHPDTSADFAARKTESAGSPDNENPDELAAYFRATTTFRKNIADEFFGWKEFQRKGKSPKRTLLDMTALEAMTGALEVMQESVPAVLQPAVQSLLTFAHQLLHLIEQFPAILQPHSDRTEATMMADSQEQLNEVITTIGLAINGVQQAEEFLSPFSKDLFEHMLIEGTVEMLLKGNADSASGAGEDRLREDVRKALSENDSPSFRTLLHKSRHQWVKEMRTLMTDELHKTADELKTAAKVSEDYLRFIPGNLFSDTMEETWKKFGKSTPHIIIAGHVGDAAALFTDLARQLKKLAPQHTFMDDITFMDKGVLAKTIREGLTSERYSMGLIKLMKGKLKIEPKPDPFFEYMKKSNSSFLDWFRLIAKHRFPKPEHNLLPELDWRPELNDANKSMMNSLRLITTHQFFWHHEEKLPPKFPPSRITFSQHQGDGLLKLIKKDWRPVESKASFSSAALTLLSATKKILDTSEALEIAAFEADKLSRKKMYQTSLAKETRSSGNAIQVALEAFIATVTEPQEPDKAVIHAEAKSSALASLTAAGEMAHRLAEALDNTLEKERQERPNYFPEAKNNAEHEDFHAFKGSLELASVRLIRATQDLKRASALTQQGVSEMKELLHLLKNVRHNTKGVKDIIGNATESLTRHRLDNFSIDGRLAKDMGMWVKGQLEQYAQENPDDDPELIERAMDQILNDMLKDRFGRVNDPDAVLLRNSVARAIDDAVERTMSLPPDVEQQLLSSETFSEYLQKWGSKKVTATGAVAVVASAVGMGSEILESLISFNPRKNLMVPRMSWLKAKLAPITIYLGVQALKKCVMPNQGSADKAVMTYLKREIPKAAFKLMTSFLPRGVNMAMAVPLAGLSLYNKTRTEWVKSAMTRLPVDSAFALGYAGAVAAQNRFLNIKSKTGGGNLSGFRSDAGGEPSRSGIAHDDSNLSGYIKAHSSPLRHAEELSTRPSGLDYYTAAGAESGAEHHDSEQHDFHKPKRRIRRSASEHDMAFSGRGAASDSEDMQQWQEELEEHKSNVRLTTDLLNSTVETRRESARAWARSNQFYRSFKPHLETLNKNMEQHTHSLNAFKKDPLRHSDEYLDLHESIIRRAAENGQVDTIFDAFRKGLISKVPANDMLHFSGTEKLEALNIRYPHEKVENILLAMFAASEDTWPESIKADASLSEDIRILMRPTPEEKEASQARWDNYWLQGMSSHLTAKEMEKVLVSERLKDAQLSEVAGNEVASDTPVTLEIKAESWLVSFLEKEGLISSKFGTAGKELGKHSIQVSMADWVSGRWINLYMQQLNVLYSLSEPVSHHKPKIVKAMVGNTSLNARQIDVMTESINEDTNKRMALVLYANKETRDIIRRERMREIRGSLSSVQDKIDKLTLTDTAADHLKRKIQRLLAGEKEPHGTFSITSREGKLPLEGVIWFKSYGRAYLFSRKTGKHLFVPETELNKLNNTALSPDHNAALVSFILEHADAKQANDMVIFVGNKLQKFRDDFESRYASSTSKFANKKFRSALWNERIKEKSEWFSKIKSELKEQYAHHSDKQRIYGEIDNLTRSPEAFDKVIKLYRAANPDKDYEVKMTIQVNEKTETLDKTMNEFLLWEQTSTGRAFDMNTTTAEEETERQDDATTWFAVSMVTAIITGGAASAAGATLKLSSMAIWWLTALAQAGVEGAQEWLKATNLINEEERAAAMAGIPVAMLTSLGMDVGVDRAIIPLAKKALKGIKAGLKNVDISDAVRHISTLRSGKLLQQSNEWSQGTGLSRTNHVVETIMESDRIKTLLETRTRQEIREQITRSVEGYRARHAADELSFSDEVAAGFRGLTPLSNAGTVTDFGQMDTYAKVNHLQSYAMETPAGKALAAESGPQGESLVKQLAVKHLTNDFYGTPKRNHVWASEQLEQARINILLQSELDKMENVKKGLALMARTGNDMRPVVPAGNSATERQSIARWSAGYRAGRMTASYMAVIDSHANAPLNDFATLQKINQRLTIMEGQLSQPVTYDPHYLHAALGEAGFLTWLKSADRANPSFAEMLYQAMLLYRPFKEGNEETAKMVYGMAKLQKGEHFSVYSPSVSTPEHVLMSVDLHAQAPATVSYATDRNKVSRDATGIIYKHEAGLMKDYVPEQGAAASAFSATLNKARRDAEFLRKIYGENQVKLYHYYVNGQQKVSVWLNFSAAFSLERTIGKDVDLGASGSLKMRYAAGIDELFDSLQKEGIVLSKADLTDIMYNSVTQQATLMNFDNASLLQNAHQVIEMRNARSSIKSQVDSFAENYSYTKLRDYRSFAESYKDRKFTRNKYKNLIESYKPAEGESSLAIKQNNRYREFTAGAQEYLQDPAGSLAKLVASKKIPKNHKNLTDVELINTTQFITASSTLTDREKGILSKLIQDKVKKYTIKDADEFHEFWYKKYKYGSNKSYKFNQFTMLTSIERPTDGRCRPLTLVMAAAIENGRGKAYSAQLKGISDDIMSSNGGQQTTLIAQGQNYESVLRKAHAMAFSYSETKSVTISAFTDTLDKATTTSYFQVNTKQHSMLTAVTIINGKKKFYFFDPNYGLFEFSSASDMEKALTKTLGETEFAASMGAEMVSGSPRYDLVKIENIAELGQQKISDAGTDVTISDLSKEDIASRLKPHT